MKFLAACLLTAVLEVTGKHAKAEETIVQPFLQGSYAIVEGGVNFTAPTDTYNPFLSRTQRAKLKTGYAISVAGGYKWSSGIRTELEFSYHRNNFKNFDNSANPYTGRQVTATIMANALYDIPTGSRITPYIGGGVGGTMAWFKDITQVNFSATYFFNEDSTRFAYQGIVGVAIAIAPQFEALIDFRYRGSDGHEFVLSPNVRRDYEIHETTAMIGFRYAL